MRKFITVVGLFFFFVIAGGALSLSSFLPGVVSRTVVVTLTAIVFAASFLWLLVERLRLFYAGVGSVWKHGGLSLVNLLLLLAAFAAAYAKLGVADTTSGNEELTHSYAEAAYFSVVTFTTLGYGDIQPRAIGRVLACIQAMLGYIVLGLLASTAASLMQAQAKEIRERREEPDG